VEKSILQKMGMILEAMIVEKKNNEGKYIFLFLAIVNVVDLHFTVLCPSEQELLITEEIFDGNHQQFYDEERAQGFYFLKNMVSRKKRFCSSSCKIFFILDLCTFLTPIIDQK